MLVADKANSFARALMKDFRRPHIALVGYIPKSANPAHMFALYHATLKPSWAALIAAT